MERTLQWFRKKVDRDCQYCQGLLNGNLRIPTKELIHGSLAGCPSCLMLYQSITTFDLCDPRIDLIHVRFYGDSQVSHTFDPKSEAMSRHLRTEEGTRIDFEISGEDNCITDLAMTRFQHRRLDRRPFISYRGSIPSGGAYSSVVYPSRSVLL